MQKQQPSTVLLAVKKKIPYKLSTVNLSQKINSAAQHCSTASQHLSATSQNSHWIKDPNPQPLKRICFSYATGNHSNKHKHCYVVAKQTKPTAKRCFSALQQKFFNVSKTLDNQQCNFEFNDSVFF